MKSSSRLDESEPLRREEPISSRVERALKASGYRDLSGLQCRAEGDVITLEGTVGSFFLKQMAQTVVARVLGVARINNRVHVS